MFEMEEAIMFAPRKEEYINPTTGETVHEAAEDQHLEENLERYELAVQEAPSLMVHNNSEENDDWGSIQ